MAEGLEAKKNTSRPGAPGTVIYPWRNKHTCDMGRIYAHAYVMCMHNMHMHLCMCMSHVTC